MMRYKKPFLICQCYQLGQKAKTKNTIVWRLQNSSLTSVISKTRFYTGMESNGAAKLILLTFCTFTQCVGPHWLGKFWWLFIESNLSLY